MELNFQPPSAALSAYVSTFYLYRNDTALVEGIERADVGQIRFMLKGSGSLSFAGGYSEPSCAVMINGPGTGAAAYRVNGPFHCFGAAMRPIGWCALIGLPAHERADHVTDGEALFGLEATGLLDTFRHTETLAEMVALAEPFLLRRLRPIPPDHVRMAEAVQDWLREDPADAQALFAALPWSERHATRIINQYFGAGPKRLVRKWRALRAAARLLEGEDPRDVAEAFYDQPHMIRELREFTGHTPRTLPQNADPVMIATLRHDAFSEQAALDRLRADRVAAVAAKGS